MEIPELPKQKRLRLEKEYGLNKDQIDLLIQDRKMAEYFEAIVSELKQEKKDEEFAGREVDLEKNIQLAINYLTSDLKGLMIGEGLSEFYGLKVSAENFSDLILLLSSGKISSRAGKDILKKMYETGGDPNEILKSEDLSQMSDEGELTEIAKKIIEAYPEPAEDYKKGKDAALMFFVGQAMKELKGKGNPQVLQEVFKNLLQK
jgi:aspartyl-tRNA(Asn)/glutamyl-tRNA(Gln) amidotransferase subunit B